MVLSHKEQVLPEVLDLGDLLATRHLVDVFSCCLHHLLHPVLLLLLLLGLGGGQRWRGGEEERTARTTRRGEGEGEKESVRRREKEEELVNQEICVFIDYYLSDLLRTSLVTN